MTDRIFAKKYVIQEEIARGGMGVLYKAFDRTAHRVVAIKQIHAHLSGDPSFAERFLREARAMARIQHDNIVTLYNIEEDEGTQSLVMEFFGPTNLRTLIRQPHRIPLRDVVRIAEQLASALAYAHAQGIIHRDIKPANVLIDKRGKAKLTDFGIAAALDEASITSTGQVIGTPEYMSPEQAKGVKLDGRSDLYSLGIMIYEMVNGKPPYHDTSKTAILGKLVFEQQELPLQFPAGLPLMLQGVIRDLLRRNPDERIPDADTLAAQLHEILYTLPQSQTTPSVESEPTMVSSPPKLQPSPEEPTQLATPKATVIPEPRTRTTEEEATRLVQPPVSAKAEFVEKTPSHDLDETRLLPPQSPPPQAPKPPDHKPTPPPPPTMPRKQSSSPPILLVVMMVLALVGAIVGIVWYIASQPEPAHEAVVSNTPPEKKGSEDAAAKNEELAAQRRELEEETKRIAEKKRLADEQLVKEEAERKEQERQQQIAAQRAKDQEQKQKLVDQEKQRREALQAKEAADRLDQERQREAAAQRVREEERKKRLAEEEKARLAQQAKEDAEHAQAEEKRKVAEEEKARQNARQREQERLAKAFPDAQLTSLLNKFQRAYERCDMDTLQSISQMSERRKDNVEFMFSNYTGFTATLKDVTQTQEGATATLILHTGTRVSGETIPIRPISGTYKLEVRRRGNEWDKIVW